MKPGKPLSLQYSAKKLFFPHIFTDH